MGEQDGNTKVDSSPILEARQIGRALRDEEHWLLRDISLTVRARQRIAVVGPTGSGKTLLLRALTLLDPLDAGMILFNGERITPRTVPLFRSRVIHVSQRPALFPGTVEDNFRIPFRLGTHVRRRFDKRRILGLLRALGRDEDFLEKDGRSLSGGECQIMATLRALQLDPQMLLFDEPTAALDDTSAQALEHTVHRWQADANRAFVWVSHQRQQIERIADHVFTMRDGRLTED